MVLTASTLLYLYQVFCKCHNNGLIYRYSPLFLHSSNFMGIHAAGHIFDECVFPRNPISGAWVWVRPNISTFIDVYIVTAMPCSTLGSSIGSLVVGAYVRRHMHA